MVHFSIIFILIISFLLWELFYSLYFFKKGKILSQNTHIKNIEIGNKSKTKLKLLVAGDSIGAGVGASSFETSVAGRTANYLSKNYFVISKNISVNGHKIKNLLTNKITNERYNLTIIFISSNDALKFIDLKEFEIDTNKTLQN